MNGVFELVRNSDHAIFAVPYRQGRASRPTRLPEGTIVESASDSDRSEVPIHAPDSFEVGHGQVPATVNHAVLGLIVGFLPSAGIYRLIGGDVAVIYGATPVSIDCGSNVQTEA